MDDEVRVAGVRSADWIDLQYHAMTNALLNFGPVETSDDSGDGN